MSSSAAGAHEILQEEVNGFLVAVMAEQHDGGGPGNASHDGGPIAPVPRPGNALVDAENDEHAGEGNGDGQPADGGYGLAQKDAGHDRCPHGIEIKQDHGADDFRVEEGEGIEKLGERHAEADGEKPEAAGALLAPAGKKERQENDGRAWR